MGGGVPEPEFHAASVGDESMGASQRPFKPPPTSVPCFEHDVLRFIGLWFGSEVSVPAAYEQLSRTWVRLRRSRHEGIGRGIERWQEEW